MSADLITKKFSEPSELQAPNNNNQQLSPMELFGRLCLQSQNNLTRLIGMQEQQMIYINAVFKEVINEQQQKTKAGISQPIDNGVKPKKD